ncbi:C8orf82 isoform 3 [Pan troglodytes]|uniref:C8orf82 isoform 3 n=2 Tax=Pan TaxID=9596 RepID=A0A2J8PXB7_PANTR|nr:C8orf82 isoform 3 [Pan troglodytes]
MWPPCGTLRTLVLARSRGARACSGDGGVSYTQGQSPEPRTREYFYYVDHQGQLFLDDSKMKNFITCFKGNAVPPSPAPSFSLPGSP